MDRLILGTRRYSSWSMRGWLAVRLAGLVVSDVVIPLRGGYTPEVKAVSPSGLVPVLEHQGALIWDSLAIIEYCAEHSPALWPADRAARAHARSIAAEMHAGFRALRLAMPMNLGLLRPGVGQAPDVLADLARIELIWRDTRARFGGGGPFLFGERFTAADAMYAPVVARTLSYRPVLTEESQRYCEAVREHALVASWYQMAMAEPEGWRVPKFEDIR